MKLNYDELWLKTRNEYASIWINFNLNLLIKERRLRKDEKLNKIDLEIRKNQTMNEVKFLLKLNKIINVPKVIAWDEYTIIMEFLGLNSFYSLLKESSESFNYKQMFFELGKVVAKLHENGIIHNDLVTGNLILKDDEIYFIDFGESFESNDLHDFVKDILTIKNDLKQNHQNILDAFNYFLEGYKKSKYYKMVIDKINKIVSN